MKIKGFQGTSLLDFPGRIASLVFFGGCNLSCPFCHNPSLVLDPEQYPDYPLAALLEELRERRSFIDGGVVSGGEPTIDKGLLPLLREIKALALEVKLDTNGLAPSVLKQAMAEGLVDYVALDLKTAVDRYRELHRGPVDLAALRESIRLLLDGCVDYEIRTTCVPGLVETADLWSMGQSIRGARSWVLQQFVARHAMDESLHAQSPHPPEQIRAFAEIAATFAEQVSIRGL